MRPESPPPLPDPPPPLPLMLGSTRTTTCTFAMTRASTVTAGGGVGGGGGGAGPPAPPPRAPRAPPPPAPPPPGAGPRPPPPPPPRPASQAVNRTYAVPLFSALDASRPFRQVSNGFVGAASDGLSQLDAAHALGAPNDTASNGNLVQTAQLDLGEEAGITVALGFGTTQSDAVAAAAGSLRAGFDGVRQSFDAGWRAYDASLIKPPAQVAGVTGAQWRRLVDGYYLSANGVKASVDKTFPRAIGASLASPR